LAGDPLVKVLEDRRAEIRERWVKEVVSSSPKYADMPPEEVLKSVDTMMSGVAAAASTGDYSILFDFIARIVTTRTSMGFKLTELQRVVNIGTSIVLDELKEYCEIDEQDECFSAMRRLLDVMFWASMNLGDTFEDIRSKEFTAGTLVALGAAHEDMDEKEILRKSLELVMGLMRCDHGAISMMHLGGCAITVPREHRQCQELFSRLGGRVTRTETTVVLEEEEVSRLARPDPDRKEEAIRCAAGVPIRARGKVMGALMLGSSYERTLSPHEGGFLEAVASQIGLACDNARLIEKIKDSERFLRKEHGEVLTVLNELGAMVYVADMETYELLAANRPLLDAFGKDIVGKVCYETLQTDQDGPCAFCTNRHLVRDGAPTGPYMWKLKNTMTGKWYQCLDRAIDWPDGRLVRLEIALDITDLELAKARLEEIGAMLELYNDLLVHDIGNYAGAAKAFVQLLTDPGTEEGKRQEMARTALSQLRKIDTLVDRISKLTKTKAGRKAPMEDADLGRLLDESISDISGTLEGSKVEFKREYDRTGYPVRLGEFAGDIFLNLLSNAVKYGAGRPITVRISDSALAGEPAWKVSVADEGPGIPSEKKKSLFDRYARLTTMSQLKGQGLGLTIVKTLTEAYGGEAGLEDRVEGDHTKGSIFSVTFPKAGPRRP
jgi:two-component system phosphate regulon sensor histidine kinase PhoR